MVEFTTAPPTEFPGKRVLRRLFEPRVTLAVAAAAAFVLGFSYILAPGAALSPYGLAEPNEIWIKVVGVLAVAIGVLHAGGAIANSTWYFRTSVIERVAAGLLQIGLAAGSGPWQLGLFGSLDLVSALWTAAALLVVNGRAR